VGNYSTGAEFFFFSAVTPIPTEIQIAIPSAMLRMNFEEGFLGMQILSFSVGLKTAVLSWNSRPALSYGICFSVEYAT
jgi:hypothetical protein